jgi:hypothetical protein
MAPYQPKFPDFDNWLYKKALLFLFFSLPTSFLPLQ